MIRFDNRDAGARRRSTAAPAVAGELLRRSMKRRDLHLGDMAGDAVGLLDYLGIERAHVVGASMGGMIAQTLAARHPERVLSLLSIMSNTGARWSGQPAFALYPVLLKRPGRSRGVRRPRVSMFAQIGSPGSTTTRTIRALAVRSYDRDNDRPAGRQLAAIIASGDRTREIARHHRPDARHPRHRRPAVRPRAARRPRGRSRARAW